MRVSKFLTWIGLAFLAALFTLWQGFEVGSFDQEGWFGLPLYIWALGTGVLCGWGYFELVNKLTSLFYSYSTAMIIVLFLAVPASWALHKYVATDICMVNEEESNRTGTVVYYHYFYGGDTSTTATSSSTSSSSSDGAEGIVYVVLVLYIIALLTISALVPHFWIVASVNFITIMVVLAIREHTAEDNKHSNWRYS